MKKKILAEIEKRLLINQEVINNHEKYTDSISSTQIVDRCSARMGELHTLKKIIFKLK